ncbi:MAG TPA: hypothetical protein VHY78_09860 [Stellaceae bacterium]|jgi:hypothetical protein|nr:hypothetical protein [Stellaceae bacterium]
MKQHLLRLDRIAGQMNAWLLVIAIGLGMLDLAVLVAKCMPAMTVPPAATGTAGHDHAILSPSQADNPRS